jgi:hypothetical protein
MEEDNTIGKVYAKWAEHQSRKSTKWERELIEELSKIATSDPYIKLATSPFTYHDTPTWPNASAYTTASANANNAFAFFAILEIALISAISVKGFEGVSK